MVLNVIYGTVYGAYGLGLEDTSQLARDHFGGEMVPWRAEMDRAANQLIAGRVNGRSFDFKVGREAEKAMKAWQW